MDDGYRAAQYAYDCAEPDYHDSDACEDCGGTAVDCPTCYREPEDPCVRCGLESSVDVASGPHCSACVIHCARCGGRGRVFVVDVDPDGRPLPASDVECPFCAGWGTVPRG